MSDDNKTPLNPITPKELAALYKVHPKTLRKWLRKEKHYAKIGERIGRFYTNQQLRRIYECIGPPGGNYRE